jgi:hypothetical protein
MLLVHLQTEGQALEQQRTTARARRVFAERLWRREESPAFGRLKMCMARKLRRMHGVRPG